MELYIELKYMGLLYMKHLFMALLFMELVSAKRSVLTCQLICRLKRKLHYPLREQFPLKGRWPESQRSSGYQLKPPERLVFTMRSFTVGGFTTDSREIT